VQHTHSLDAIDFICGKFATAGAASAATNGDALRRKSHQESAACAKLSGAVTDIIEEYQLRQQFVPLHAYRVVITTNKQKSALITRAK